MSVEWWVGTLQDMIGILCLRSYKSTRYSLGLLIFQLSGHQLQDCEQLA